MRFDIGGPRSLCVQIGGGGGRNGAVGGSSSRGGSSSSSGGSRSQSASPNEADRSCNGSTASSSSSNSAASSSRLSAANSVSSSGYFSLTDFGPCTSLRNSRSISTTSTSSTAAAANGGGSSFVSPQDYLNNPMFDSLNNRSHKLHWGQSGSDKTITLKPLSMLTKKRKKSSSSNLHRKFGVNMSSSHSNFNHHHGLHHLNIGNLPSQPPSKSACKVL